MSSLSMVSGVLILGQQTFLLQFCHNYDMVDCAVVEKNGEFMWKW